MVAIVMSAKTKRHALDMVGLNQQLGLHANVLNLVNIVALSVHLNQQK